MSLSLRMIFGCFLVLFTYSSSANIWWHYAWARDSAGSNYPIDKKMTVGWGSCGGISELVGIPATGTTDFTPTEADEVANWLQVYKGLSKVALTEPASITYNCFPYAIGPALVWAQDYPLVGCALDSQFTEVGQITQNGIAVHYGHHYQTHEDIVHASKVFVFFTYNGQNFYGLKGKYGWGGVYNTGVHYPSQHYGTDQDDDLFYVANP